MNPERPPAGLRPAGAGQRTKYPKKPPNAFVLFVNEKRPSFREQNPDISATNLLKELSRQWKEMTPEQKQPYVDVSTQLIANFKAQNPDYKYRKTKNQARKYNVVMKNLTRIENMSALNELYQSNPFLLQHLLVHNEVENSPSLGDLFYPKKRN